MCEFRCAMVFLRVLIDIIKYICEVQPRDNFINPTLKLTYHRYIWCWNLEFAVFVSDIILHPKFFVLVT